ncbi:MAG: bifunctional lysylphosphatidylglycerol flippase/synthetase MprF [Roseiarcus sp.]|jgi:phosphatidylglycerol lysyltransferase
MKSLADGRAKEPTLPQIGSRWRKLLVALAVLVAGAVLVVPFGDVVANLDYHAMIGALRRMSAASIALSIGATALSFAALVGRDASALRYVGARISFSALVLAGFCGSALGNAAGFGAFTAAAVRYRVYGAVGVKSEDIARLLLFVLGGFALGLASVGGVATLLEADPVAVLLGWSATPLRILASAALASVASFFIFALRGEARIGGVLIAAPTTTVAATQLALTSIRLFGAALALWALLPTTQVSFPEFAAIFSAATALGAISHIPGGVGVFELVVLWAFRGQASSDAVAAALLAYRGVYYVLPLILSSALFAVFEVRSAVRGRLASDDDRLARAATRLSPTFIGVLTFAAGVMLLVSGATPTFGGRLTALSLHVPLWAVETSHFLGSLIGVIFLFVARGLVDRRDGAWRIAFWLTLASLGFSLMKGLAFAEAGFLTVLAMLLLATRPQFHRPTSMLDQPFTIGWFAAVGVIIAAAFGILVLAFNGVDLRARDLWWQFAFDAQAPRAMRALVGASALAVCFGVGQLLRAPKGLAKLPSEAALAAAAQIIRRQGRSDALLALMGDKSLIFSQSGDSFLMYGKRGRSWIALFDPIGPKTEWAELIKRFVTLAHAHGGRAAFYQIPPESLPFYLDAGLTVMKLGEDARVRLASFRLEGGAAAHLRYALKRGARDGLTFELIRPKCSGAAMETIAAISHEWLEARAGDEKAFSVAAFEPQFIEQQWIAIVRQQGEAIAFASVMTTDARNEASVGLMRHRAKASPYAMEFLFTQLILALKSEGFETLSLGVAPLSGVRREPLSSRWHWVGAQIWKHGDRFYNFQGLRMFKGKFNPAWEPRYLAASGTVGPFVALADAAALIAKSTATKISA